MAISPLNNNPDSVDWEAQVVYLRELAAIARDQNLTELEIDSAGVRLYLKAPTMGFTQTVTSIGTHNAGAAPVLPRMGAGTGSTSSDGTEDSKIPVVSPMVGVFFRAPSPTDPNFVEVGDRVERGQTIGLVEAMKVFNEIVTESAGTVVEVLAATGDLVETGQHLVRLKRA